MILPGLLGMNLPISLALPLPSSCVRAPLETTNLESSPTTWKNRAGRLPGQTSPCYIYEYVYIYTHNYYIIIYIYIYKSISIDIYSISIGYYWIISQNLGNTMGVSHLYGVTNNWVLSCHIPWGYATVTNHWGTHFRICGWNSKSQSPLPHP